MTLSLLHTNRFATMVVAVLAYYLAGLIGLQLAIPPGFASAVWPASGVALALAVIFHATSVIVGTFLASFLLNLQLVMKASGDVNVSLAVVPFFIALGAALQAGVGARLFRYFSKQKLTSDMAHTITRFASIVVPVGCLVSASVGVATLRINDVISSDEMLFSWFIWWLGDGIGVLLFTPMLMVILADKRYFKFSRRFQVVVPTVFIFSCSSALFFWSVNNTQEALQSEFDRKAKRYSQNIAERLELSKSKVQSYQAFFQGSNYISYNEFEQFSKALLGKVNTLHGVGWTEITPHRERKNTVNALREQGYPDFEFTAPSQDGMVKLRIKDVYYPVLYVYPYEQNRRALGLDLSELPGRLDILNSIEQTGKGRVTPPITLVQENENERSFIIYLPVWKKYTNNEELRGFISGVYRASGILGSVLNDAQKHNIGILISDISSKSGAEVLIERAVSAHSFIEANQFTIDFHGSQYQIVISPSAEYVSNVNDWVSWVILICGFFISALVQAFILMMSGAIEHTNEMVKRKTKQLTLAIEKAQSASQAKSMFLANMNHELRTPLNAIIGLVTLCLKTDLSNKQASYLQDAKLATHTLMSLINQSLDYAKIESGKLELEKIEFDLSDVIKKIYAVFQMQAKQKGIDFKLIIDTHINRMFMGDPLRIEQVLLNLCSNALKFTDVGSVSINVTAKTISHQHEEVIIRIKDSGIGISKEQQATLFQSFQQADNTTTRKYGGTGLGLAISKQLVELMGGHIVINSEIGKGCEFVITLRLQKTQQSTTFTSQTIEQGYLADESADETDNRIEIASASESKQKMSLHGVRVLLVEDIEINRMIATELLESYGAKVTQACDGQQAVDTLKSDNDFDVVLMDIQMPVMDGLQATKVIRAVPQLAKIPILAMTANAMNEDIDNCHAAGMNGHIAKPIDESHMVSSILASLPGPQAQS